MGTLVVDDTKMSIFIAEKTLKGLGVEAVFTAEDGVQALEIFKNESIDVIFSDWNMPNMNGLELLIEVRKLNKEVPFIMVTTEGCRGKISEAVGHGVNDYLVKPFAPDAILKKMEKWVSTLQPAS